VTSLMQAVGRNSANLSIRPSGPVAGAFDLMQLEDPTRPGKSSTGYSGEQVGEMASRMVSPGHFQYSGKA
jgi:hypothetical protein